MIIWSIYYTHTHYKDTHTLHAYSVPFFPKLVNFSHEMHHTHKHTLIKPLFGALPYTLDD